MLYEVITEAVCGVEAAHLDRVVERRPAAAQARRGGRAGDRHHVQIELRRGAAVECELERAVMLARRQRTEVEKAEVDP